MRGLAVEQLVKAEHPRHLVDAAADLLLRCLAHAERVAEVLSRGHVRVQRVVLEDHGDIALAGRYVGDVAVAERDPAVAHVLKAGDLIRIGTTHLQLDDGVHILGPFWIHHVRNSGIAFGLFASATSVVIVLTAIAVAWMLGYFARSGARHPVLPVALGLVIGGSVSNLADRVRLGYVTDFIDLRWWPSFNLADTFIVVGVLVLLGALALSERSPRRRPQLRDAPSRPG